MSVESVTRSDAVPVGAVRRALAPAAWAVELAVLFAGLLAIELLLPPDAALLRFSPSAIWIPVLAMAVLHGTVPAVSASILGAVMLWVFEPSLSPADVDTYVAALRFWKEPVLWLAASLAIGAYRDRQAALRIELAERTERAEKQRAVIADYARSLRDQIDLLEQEIAFAAPQDGPLAANESRRSATGLRLSHAEPIEIRIGTLSAANSETGPQLVVGRAKDGRPAYLVAGPAE
ncbi:hypothetical protein GCM10011390_06410 [Aureimonas endophytica]|uniref:Histidine kinase n=1 Tax=Aureimonas endophytica TaxID=2027858 RepID=A0A917E1R3_9HYPH|nr:hypothetical protein [Aureimonas endophytica]GGD90357.1 hypothetical protein GCM10011390_06410 [Aureimonas endophytica]